jgi:uncharacterized protein YjhX (UPF0386 family)
MKLAKVQQKVLRALMQGSTLKSHRYLDGTKVYKLHALDGSTEIVEKATVDSLKEKGLIDSNKKFPAATYLLTDKGTKLAATLEPPTTFPLSAKHY